MFFPDLAMRFVTATSNLRSHVFGIEPLQSYYSAKGIAGNIIPAIATTNAICAGLQILQVFSIIKAQLELKQREAKKEDLDSLKEICCYVNCIRNKTRNGLYLTASSLELPNPKCFVCSRATIPLTLDVTKWTLEEFLKRICKARLGFEEPTIMLQGDIIWEEGEGAESETYQPNLAKHLNGLPCGGIHNGTTVDLEDFSQDLTVQVSITHNERWDMDEEQGDELPFIVSGDIPEAKAAESTSKADGGDSSAEAKLATAKDDDEDDDDIVLVIDGDDDDSDKKPAAKRSISETDSDALPPAKRAKVSNGTAEPNHDVEVIEID